MGEQVVIRGDQLPKFQGLGPAAPEWAELGANHSLSHRHGRAGRNNDKNQGE